MKSIFNIPIKGELVISVEDGSVLLQDIITKANKELERALLKVYDAIELSENIQFLDSSLKCEIWP